MTGGPDLALEDLFTVPVEELRAASQATFPALFG